MHGVNKLKRENNEDIRMFFKARQANYVYRSELKKLSKNRFLYMNKSIQILFEQICRLLHSFQWKHWPCFCHTGSTQWSVEHMVLVYIIHMSSYTLQSQSHPHHGQIHPRTLYLGEVGAICSWRLHLGLHRNISTVPRGGHFVALK